MSGDLLARVTHPGHVAGPKT